MLALSVACAAAAAVWAYLVLGHGGYWRTGQRLPPSGAAAPDAAPDGVAAGPDVAVRWPDVGIRWPDVVAVIPARNEAAMLPAVLPALLGQDYPGALTVILVDDCSTDGTAEVAAALGPEPGRPGRALRVVPGAPLPPGWAGKVWAMAQGLADGLAHGLAHGLANGLAGGGEDGARGYVLFTDAD